MTKLDIIKGSVSGIISDNDIAINVSEDLYNNITIKYDNNVIEKLYYTDIVKLKKSTKKTIVYYNKDYYFIWFKEKIFVIYVYDSYGDIEIIKDKIICISGRDYYIIIDDEYEIIRHRIR